MLDQLRDKVRRFPEQPGVYLLKDKSGRVIYVGKAVSLRQRVRSYLVGNVSGSARLKSLQKRLADIDYVVTGSEVEALILEGSLIKEYRPRFNVRLKDDKDYPYLIITPELFPRLELLRLSQLGSKRARYTAAPGREEKRYGPYTDVKAVKDTMQLLGLLFPLRRCRQPLDGAPTGERPCLNFQMKRCTGPCRGEESVSPEDYYKMVQQIELFLEGRYSRLEGELKDQMEEAASSERFEEAALLRDRLHALQRVASQQQKILLTKNSPDRDVIALSRLKEHAAVHLFQLRDGKLLHQEHFGLSGTAEVEDSEVMASFLQSYYGRLEKLPREILLSTDVTDIDVITGWLREKAGRTVRIATPRRGSLKKLVELAEKNGLLRLEEDMGRLKREKTEHLLELGRLAGLDEAPERIEAYDISHLRGDYPVGAMAVFLDGEAHNSSYRRFKIREAPAGDDYSALKEVLKRRAGREKWPRPDLILIDGGRGQLNSAREALRGTAVADVPLVALAKNPDRLFLTGNPVPFRMAANDPLLRLLQQIRDEVHRFAISGHRTGKNRQALQSLLENVPGVGPARRRALLEHFGSIEGIRQASPEQLSTLPGITKNLAVRIHALLAKSHGQGDK